MNEDETIARTLQQEEYNSSAFQNVGPEYSDIALKKGIAASVNIDQKHSHANPHSQDEPLTSINIIEDEGDTLPDEWETDGPRAGDMNDEYNDICLDAAHWNPDIQIITDGETTVPGANSEGDRFIRPIAPSNTTPGNPAHQSDKKTTNNNEYQQADYDLAQTLHDQELAYQLQFKDYEPHHHAKNDSPPISPPCPNTPTKHTPPFGFVHRGGHVGRTPPHVRTPRSRGRGGSFDVPLTPGRRIGHNDAPEHEIVGIFNNIRIAASPYAHRQQALMPLDIDEMQELAELESGDNYEALWNLAERVGDVNTGLSTYQIARLPQYSSSQMKESKNAEDNKCQICQEDFQLASDGGACGATASDDATLLRMLQCMHRFHKNCIDPWIMNKPFCPVCRYDIKEDLEKSTT